MLWWIAFVVVGICTLTDLRKREVPDSLSMGLMALGVVIAFIRSFTHGFHLLWESVLGLVLWFGVGYFLYRTGQWGGGDAKLLGGIGALFGFTFSIDSFVLSYFVNTLLLGAVLGLVWGVVLGVLRRKELTLTWPTWTGKYCLVVVVLTLLAVFTFPMLLLPLSLTGGVLIVCFFLLFYLKAVQDQLMQKKIKVQDLEEGDWLLEDITVEGKKITKKGIGLSQKEITLLQKAKKRVFIREGIPFVPAFFFALFVTPVYGNLLFLVMAF